MDAASEMDAIIFGLGPRGLEHAEAIRQTAGLKLTGVCEISAPARERVIQTIGCPAFSSPEEILKECDPELAVIATPPRVRQEIVEQLVHCARLRTIVIEKPLALSLQEARSIFAVCRERSIRVRVCHQLRFSREFALLGEAVQNDAVGSIRAVQAFCYGNLLNQGIHMIDAVQWLMNGQHAEWVSAQAINDLVQLGRLTTIPADFAEDVSHPAPLSVQATIGFSGGVQAALTTGLLAPSVEPALGNWLQKRIVVFGTQGSAEAHVASGFKLFNAAHPDGSLEKTGLESYRDATRAFYGELLADLQSNRSFDQDNATTMGSMQILAGCFESILKGGPISLPLVEDSDPLLSWRQRARADAGAVLEVATDTHAGQPRISVILPMEDHRGLGIEAIESWVNEQRCDPQDFELIVIVDSATRALEPAIRARLRPIDRLVHLPTRNEMQAYDAGARLARGEYLLLSEPHCLAEPQAIAEAIHFFRTHPHAGFCPRTIPIYANAVGAMEARMYEEGFAGWSQADRWEKVILRGFGIRREVYLEVGGFDHRYGRFAEWLLAARLRQGGFQLAYAPGLGVQHHYSKSFALLNRFIQEFTDGESLFRDEGPQDFARRFFGDPAEWNEARSFDPALIRVLAKSCWHEIFDQPPDPAVRTSRRAALKRLLGLLPSFVFGARLSLYKHRFRIRLAWLRFYCWWFDKDERFRAFVDWYMLTTSYHRVKFALEHPRPPVLNSPAALSYPIEKISNADFFGFHGLETYAGRSFRWSSDLAAVRLCIRPGNYRVTIQTPYVRWIDPGRELAMYMDGHRLAPAAFDDDRTRLEFDLPESLMALQDEHWLVMHCAVWRQDGVQRTDVRRLGLPVASIDLHSRS